MSDFQHGVDLINTQLLNMLQYIKNHHKDVSSKINTYKSMLNAIITINPTLIYDNLHAYLSSTHDDIYKHVEQCDDTALLNILYGLMGADNEMDDVIQFIMNMWSHQITCDEKHDIWKFISLIMKIYKKLQTIQTIHLN